MISGSLLGGVLLIVGILILVIAADRIVDAGMHVMHLYQLSATAVGVLILAVATSLPEIFVSAIASVRGNASMAYGEILGSNTANIPLIIGVCVLMTGGLEITDHFIAKRDSVFLLMSTLIAAAMMWDLEVSRTDGMVLIALFFLYIYIVRLTDSERVQTLESGKRVFHRLFQKLEGHSIAVQKRHTFFLIGISAFGLFAGAMTTVWGAELLIDTLHLSPVLIGLVAVAIGTTLPETAASVMAIRRGQTAMGVANVLGDNISSILLALGIAAILQPIGVQRSSFYIDIPAVILITLLFTILLFWKKKLPLWVGFGFLALYAGILVFYVQVHPVAGV